MPSWKKVIVSGSDAALNSLYVTNSITGSLYGTASYATVAENVTNQNYAVFTQSIAASTWTFNHNLNQRSPVITVYDATYQVIIPTSIQSTSENQSVITFSRNTTGYASATVGSILPTNLNALSLAYAIVL